MSNDQNNPTPATQATDISGETPIEANASPQVAPAASTSADEVAPDNTEAEVSSPPKKKTVGKQRQQNSSRRDRRRQRSQRGQRQNASSDKKSGAPPSMRQRLLARFVPPSIPLERDLLPEALLEALDAAALGSAELLASSAFTTMAAIAAVAGPNVTFAETAAPKISSLLTTGSSLRIVMVGDHTAAPIVPEAIMAAMFAIENDLLATHEQSVERVAALRRAAAERRRLHEQAARAAAILGNAQPPALSELTPAVTARPRIVLVNGASSALLEAAAGGTGTIIIDHRWAKSLLAGGNRDVPTVDLLNALSIGHAVPIADPRGRIEMRALPACAIGALRPGECASLHRVKTDQLLASVFVNAAAAPVGGDSAPLTALMRRIHAMATEPVALRFGSKARKLLAEAAAAWSEIDAGVAPLSDFVAGLPDLARRLAGVLHIVESARASANLDAEISVMAVKRATALADRFVLPMAQGILGPLSCEVAERDARTLVAHLRENTSPDVPVERRPWMRGQQSAMPLPRFEAALNLLLEEKLLTPTEGENGGKWYAAAPELHAVA